MTFMPGKVAKLAFAPRSRIIWLALAGFFLGTALCPFNPPSEGGPQQVKQGEIMNTPSESRVNIGNEHLNRPAPSTQLVETATFALG